MMIYNYQTTLANVRDYLDRVLNANLDRQRYAEAILEDRGPTGDEPDFSFEIKARDNVYRQPLAITFERVQRDSLITYE